jgi:hypothetical protein
MGPTIIKFQYIFFFLQTERSYSRIWCISITSHTITMDKNLKNVAFETDNDNDDCDDINNNNLTIKLITSTKI